MHNLFSNSLEGLYLFFGDEIDPAENDFNQIIEGLFI
jgi:hypothetical protein